MTSMNDDEFHTIDLPTNLLIELNRLLCEAEYIVHDTSSAKYKRLLLLKSVVRTQTPEPIVLDADQYVLNEWEYNNQQF